MDDSNETVGMKFRLGLMMITGFAILVVLIVIFSDWQSIFAGNRYKINIIFPNAPGVKENTPIKQSGILIGRVRKIELVDQGAKVTAFIDTQYKLYDNQRFRLNLTILGDAELNVIQETPRTPATQQIKPGATVEGYMIPSMMQMAADMQGDLTAAINSITNTSEKLNKILTGVDSLFTENKDDVRGMVIQIRDMCRQAQEMLAKTNLMLSDPEIQKGIHETIVNLPTAIKEATGVFSEFKITAQKINGMTGRIDTIMANTDETMSVLGQVVQKADKSMADFNSITGTMAERKGIWMTKVSRSLDNLDNALLQISEFTTTLNKGDGTIGRLVKDPTLYQKLEALLDDFHNLKMQLEPVVNNAQVFSDKIARHPEQLGVAGALKKSSGTKGVPPIPSDLQGEFQRFRSENGTIISTQPATSDGVIYGPVYEQPTSQWQPAGAY